MTSAFLDPCQILFTQASIKNEFRNGLTLEETACQLARKDIQKRQVEMINVVKHTDGREYSLDNRRLAAFRLLRMVGKCGRIKVRVVPKPAAEWQRKFDPHSDHTKILVRGCKLIVAASEADTTFPLSRIRDVMQETRLLVARQGVAALAAGEGERHVESILADMDSDGEDDEGPDVGARRPPNARQPVKGARRKKNAADQRRGNKSNGTLEFAEDLEPFAAGASRYAYRCRVRGGCVQGFSGGSYLVLKAFKPDFAHVKITPQDADMQQEVVQLAGLFNATAQPSQNGEPCEIHVRDAAVVNLGRNCCRRDGKVVLRQGENYVLEREIFGGFRKFNSNNGWQSQTGCEIPGAFSHWTWARHGKLVCDLQGYQGKPPGPKYLGARYYYLFTDPAILSKDGQYGATDLGMPGIENWFSVHECGEVCRGLGIERDRPARCRTTLPVGSSSSYRETDNLYGPRAPARTLAVAAVAVSLAAITEGESDYESD